MDNDRYVNFHPLHLDPVQPLSLARGMCMSLCSASSLQAPQSLEPVNWLSKIPVQGILALPVIEVTDPKGCDFLGNGEAPLWMAAKGECIKKNKKKQ